MSLGTVVDRGVDVTGRGAKLAIGVTARGIAWTIRKTWKPVGLGLLFIGSVVTGSHFYCPLYLRVEQSAVGMVNATFVQVAAKYGLEPRPLLVASAADYVSIVEREAVRNGFSESYGRKVVKHESGFNPRAKSPKGAVGLMQVMPANAAGCGVKPADLWDPETNVRCGFKLLRESFDRHKDARKALLAYNGGDEAVRVVTKCGDNVKCMGGFDESYRYARDILNDTATDMRG